MNDDKSFICVICHGDGTFSGLEQRYHPTPSGCDRWIDGFEDNRKWPTKKIAVNELVKTFKEMITDGNRFSHIQERLESLVRKYDGGEK